MDYKKLLLEERARARNSRVLPLGTTESAGSAAGRPLGSAESASSTAELSHAATSVDSANSASNNSAAKATKNVSSPAPSPFP